MNKLKISEFKTNLFSARLESVDNLLVPCDFECVRFGNLSFVFYFITSDYVSIKTRVMVEVKLLTSLGFNSHESVVPVRVYSFELSEKRVFLFWCLLNRLINLAKC